ncbi:MAG: hypothetical protein PXZ07_11035 [Candidatus Eremiobacteraeota bacterium]|uniref:Uncharacterized protein n=1 Tax=mine drainage metagenome TaxID=410659 RepID=E6Q2N5_9ZZZZ|nr:hypothetical protein [Candidatus Eremiobacteraeota bacterium]
MEADLRTLYERADGFHFSESTIRSLHERVGKALEGGSPTREMEVEYRRALLRYFASFDTQTRMQLRDLDRRLAELAQAQLNFSAERNVAVRRLENIGRMLGMLDGATA